MRRWQDVFAKWAAMPRLALLVAEDNELPIGVAVDLAREMESTNIELRCDLFKLVQDDDAARAAEVKRVVKIQKKMARDLG